MPASASRTATPRPAGPVPPRIPTFMATPSHNLTGPVGLLDGKRFLITGVLTDASLAFAAAKLAQEEGAEIVLSGAGRARGPRDRRHLARAVGRRRAGRGRPLAPPRRDSPRHRLRASRLPGQRHV